MGEGHRVFSDVPGAAFPDVRRMAGVVVVRIGPFVEEAGFTRSLMRIDTLYPFITLTYRIRQIKIIPRKNQ